MTKVPRLPAEYWFVHPPVTAVHFKLGFSCISSYQLSLRVVSSTRPWPCECPLSQAASGFCTDNQPVALKRTQPARIKDLDEHILNHLLCTLDMTSKSQCALVHAWSCAVFTTARICCCWSGVAGNAKTRRCGHTSLEAPTGPQELQGGSAQEESIIN